MRCMKPSFLSPILERVARELGCESIIEPAYRYAGQIVLPDGRRWSFAHGHLDVNTLGAAALAKDKAYAAYFLSQAGFPVPEGEAFYSAGWARAIGSDRTPAAAVAYARRLGFPVYVKPNGLSEGRGVECIASAAALRRSLRRIVCLDRVYLVQRPVPGHDVRVVVFDGAAPIAYLRRPLAVVGDDISTIDVLLRSRLRQLRAAGRPLRIVPSDPRITAKLRAFRLRRASVPVRGARVPLLDAANCSTGGDLADVSDALHPTLRTLAIRAAAALGLRYAGVDLLVDGDLATPAPATVLEVNSSPGIEHYASSSPEAFGRVEALYRAMLRDAIGGAWVSTETVAAQTVGRF